MRRAWRALRRFWESDRGLSVFLVLLVLFLFVLPPFVELDGSGRGLIFDLGLSVLLLAGVAAVSTHRAVRALLFVLGVGARVVRWGPSAAPAPAAAALVTGVAMTFVVLGQAFRAGPVNVHRIKIQQAAEWYATLTPGVTNHGMGIEHLPSVMETLHAHFILSALCGNVDEKGGDIFATPYPGIIHEQAIAAHERLAETQINKTLGIDRFRLLSRKGFDLVQSHVKRVYGHEAFNRTSYEAFAHGPTIYRAALTGKPYPVRAMITLSSNPMVTVPNTRLVYQALKSLDLYVVADFFMTPSGQMADYVLPATTYLERPWLWTYSGVVGSERALPKTVQGRYDRRDDYDIAALAVSARVSGKIGRMAQRTTISATTR